MKNKGHKMPPTDKKTFETFVLLIQVKVLLFVQKNLFVSANVKQINCRVEIHPASLSVVTRKVPVNDKDSIFLFGESQSGTRRVLLIKESKKS